MENPKPIVAQVPEDLPKGEEQTEVFEEHVGFLALKEQKPFKVSGEIALRLISSRFYVHENTKVYDLLQDFQRHPYIPACGVVGEDMKLKGIIVREKFLFALTQPYLLEVYRHRPVLSLIMQAKSYFYHTHIYVLAEELSEHIENREEEFFLLKDEKDGYVGLFSTRDLLIYLSRIMQKDIRAAREVQRNLVPEEIVYHRDVFSFLGGSRPAKEVGGDFYGWKTSQDGIVFLLCDVSGKGPSASLITTSVSGLFHGFEFSLKRMPDFLQMLNAYLFSAFHGEKYLTGIFGFFHEKTGACHLWDMGHGHIVLQRKHRIYLTEVKENNVPIGLFEYISPEPTRIQLHEGDMLVCFSDGIVEQKNGSGDFYGDKRLYRIIKSTLQPQLLIDAVWTDLKNFRGQYPQSDDASLLLLHYHPKE
ncbi:SpoIIE family protein phosphatase [Thermospira aquatica]|uniref:SpoIIE family protein phosphatase n=1 Tax=Thermospira aquatica TaxID=2828656 RepID=A0AAX3BEW7_9SPIR|nr:SpoIIE family protein phosphatase [Thermospira aquatica]URA10673.1 SpoIIE family protein phosphatase [Thermospira aquatica]